MTVNYREGLELLQVNGRFKIESLVVVTLLKYEFDLANVCSNKDDASARGFVSCPWSTLMCHPVSHSPHHTGAGAGRQSLPVVYCAALTLRHTEQPSLPVMLLNKHSSTFLTTKSAGCELYIKKCFTAHQNLCN